SLPALPLASTARTHRYAVAPPVVGPVTVQGALPVLETPVAIDSHGPVGPLRDSMRSTPVTPPSASVAFHCSVRGDPTGRLSPPVGVTSWTTGSTRSPSRTLP